MHLSFFGKNMRENLKKCNVPAGQPCIEEEIVFLDNHTAKSRIII